MLKSQVAALLDEMASLLEVQSDNPFQPRAFRSAARSLEGLAGDLEEVIAAGELRSISGIGESIAREIVEMAATGTSQRLVELRAAVPRGILDLLRIPGLGSKKARVLALELGVDSLDALKSACESGSVAKLKGFGEKTQAKILEGIAYIGSVSGRFRLDDALPHAMLLIEHLQRSHRVQRVELAGSLRRGKETVKDVDIVASSSEPDAVADHFVRAPGVITVVAKGETKTSVRLANGLASDLRVVSDAEWPAALQYFTGSKEHNTELRGIARDLDWKLNEYGLFRGDEPLPLKDEASIYEALGLRYIEPELREGLGEIALAREGSLPDLLTQPELRGVVHVHTDWSDGAASLEAMVEAARARGYSYLGVTDHSQSAFYARGLTPDRVRAQRAEIDRLNSGLSDFRIFHGIESDIRPDGALDYEPAVLDIFEFVIASVHSSFQLPVEAMTERLIRAMKDPHTTFLGHPTGRLLLQRDGYLVDMDRVLRAAGELGVAVEINASPYRLDMDWRLGARARELGVRTGIHPDAHSPEGLDDVAYGVRCARKAGFGATHVVNALDAAEFAKFCARRRSGS
jgi:DNA polymerase (family 10)